MDCGRGCGGEEEKDETGPSVNFSMAQHYHRIEK
jgi:hypothetical protein